MWTGVRQRSLLVENAVDIELDVLFRSVNEGQMIPPVLFEHEVRESDALIGGRAHGDESLVEDDLELSRFRFGVESNQCDWLTITECVSLIDHLKPQADAKALHWRPVLFLDQRRFDENIFPAIVKLGIVMKRIKSTAG